MITTFEPMAVSLREDEHGVIRVGGTRVLLDMVIQQFRNGATPEGIVESYSALDLADVYAVISYYLRHPAAIDAYLHRREQEAKAVREMIESSQPRRPNLRTVAPPTGRQSGEGLLRTEGALADDPYWDDIMEEIYRERRGLGHLLEESQRYGEEAHDFSRGRDRRPRMLIRMNAR